MLTRPLRATGGEAARLTAGLFGATVSRETLVDWLREDDPARLQGLYAAADAFRRAWVGEAVHLRGLVEISSHCVRGCAYCGLRHANRDLERYRMEADEIVASAEEARALGCGTVVLQAGEDPALRAEPVADLVRRIKEVTGLAVTLSLGERDPDALALWREAGADRYLLRFETSDRRLFAQIHPGLGTRTVDRIALLRTLKALGYETGSGIMVGLPGQSWESVADDLRLFADLDLDMVGVGPWIAHPATPLGRGEGVRPLPPESQARGDAETVYKVLALTRLLRPDANIPATTALATLDQAGGGALALRRGANVIMPNVTPAHYRAGYEIYPEKVNQRAVLELLEAMGRPVGEGPGGRGAQGDRRSR